MKSTRANHTVIYVPIWIESVRRESAKQATPTIRAVYRWFFMPRQLFPAPFFIIGLCFLDFVTFHFFILMTPYRFPHRVALNCRGSSSVYRTCEYEKPVRSAMAEIATSRVGHSCNSCGYSSSIIYFEITLSGITPRSIRYSSKLTSVGSGVAAWYFSRIAAIKSLCNSFIYCKLCKNNNDYERQINCI